MSSWELGSGSPNQMSGARANLTAILIVCFGLALVVAVVLLLDRSALLTHYSCTDVLGPHPRIGFYEIIPPGWKVTMEMSFDGTPHPNFSVWDEHGRLVCDAEGKPVR